MTTQALVRRLLLGFLLLALGVPAWAGSIAVTVVDEGLGLPIPGADLTLTGDSLSAPVAAYTDSSGRAQLLALPEGLYRLSVTKGAFEARQGHAVRGYLAWDLPTDPFTVKATVFGLYTDVPSEPEPDLLRFLPPEPWIRPGEHGFVGASVLQDLDVRKGYVTLRLEASSAWDPVAPRLLVGAEYAF